MSFFAKQPPLWTRDYIDKPYKNGARGPDAYDCYGLMATAQHKEFNLDVPMFDGHIADISKSRAEFLHDVESLLQNRSGWIQIERPRPSDAILLRFGNFVAHCGVVVAVKARPKTAPPAGWMLHVHTGINVTCVEWDKSEWENRVAGFWRYVGEGNG